MTPTPLPPRRLPSTDRPVRQPGALAVLLALACAGAQAESNPWYLGVSESVTHDSNLYRLGDGVALPSTVKSRGDTSYATSLIGGLDQGIGRQRLTASAALRNYRYASNDQLNYNGYSLDTALDWSTIERVSGQLSINGSRSLRRFDPSENVSNAPTRNIETVRYIGNVVRVGLVTALTMEGSLGWRTVDYSSPAYANWAYHQTVGGAGLRYRVSDATKLGLGLRHSHTVTDNSADDYSRRDIDLTVEWLPSGLTQLNARLSHSATSHERNTSRDFSGFTGELRSYHQVTGKIRLNTSLSHDIGQSTSTFTLANLSNSAEFDRTTTSLRLGADYAATAKVSVSASVLRSWRKLNKALTSEFSIGGSDTTTTLTLGARWSPTRASLVGCDIGRESRSTDGVVSQPYGSHQFSCYGQLTIQ